ncbi:Carbonic anhydrase 2 [Pelomyxa schiedti]|nr:Carbonic anhydrase 2 [Pelomyxa schiedti]
MLITVLLEETRVYAALVSAAQSLRLSPNEYVGGGGDVGGVYTGRGADSRGEHDDEGGDRGVHERVDVRGGRGVRGGAITLGRRVRGLQRRRPVPVQLDNALHGGDIGGCVVDDKEVIRFSGYDTPVSLVAENIGSQVQLSGFANQSIIVRDGEVEYNLYQVNFHWIVGDTNTASEHIFKDTTSSQSLYAGAEVHFAHLRSDFSTFDEAINSGEQGALCILAALLQVSDSSNSEIQKLVEVSGALHTPNSNAMVYNWLPRKALPDTSFYYRYNGSITKPPCSEVVSWYVFDSPLNITVAQLQGLWSMELGNATITLSSNIRGTQALNGRTVAMPVYCGTSGDNSGNVLVAKILLGFSITVLIASVMVFSLAMFTKPRAKQ